MLHLPIKIHGSPDEAPNYNEINKKEGKEVYKGAQLIEAHIVRGGMESGRSTVDLIFEDENGQKYMILHSAALLKALATAINGVEGH